MAGFSVFAVTFNGNNGTGNISIPELKSGDFRIFWNNASEPGGGEQLNVFDQIVTTDGELHQIIDFDNTAVTYNAVFVRFS